MRALVISQNQLNFHYIQTKLYIITIPSQKNTVLFKNSFFVPHKSSYFDHFYLLQILVRSFSNRYMRGIFSRYFIEGTIQSNKTSYS